MKLSRTVDYALRATLMLAQQESQRPVPCSQLAEQGEMPERFLLQILRNLVNHGILRSTRGVDGGYALMKSARDVSLLNIMEAIEGPMCNCSQQLAENGHEPSCKQLHAALEEVSKQMCQQLDAIKLSQLLPAKAN